MLVTILSGSCRFSFCADYLEDPCHSGPHGQDASVASSSLFLRAVEEMSLPGQAMTGLPLQLRLQALQPDPEVSSKIWQGQEQVGKILAGGASLKLDAPRVPRARQEQESSRDKTKTRA